MFHRISGAISNESRDWGDYALNNFLLESQSCAYHTTWNIQDLTLQFEFLVFSKAVSSIFKHHNTARSCHSRWLHHSAASRYANLDKCPPLTTRIDPRSHRKFKPPYSWIPSTHLTVQQIKHQQGKKTKQSMLQRHCSLRHLHPQP
jgi:hypothetical protein